MRWLAVLLVTALPAQADVAQDAFVGVFFHEMAHALIDVVDLPPGPSEEDTADALAVWLMARLYQDDRARALVDAQAAMFGAFAAQGGVAFRGGHAPDAARAARLPCLLAGDGCAAERAVLWAEFDVALQGRPPQDSGPRLRVVAAKGRAGAAVRAAVEAFNGEMGLPLQVDVTVEPCGVADAFYDPRARRVVMCTEFAGELARMLN
jgi:hypothetical protein